VTSRNDLTPAPTVGAGVAVGRRVLTVAVALVSAITLGAAAMSSISTTRALGTAGADAAGAAADHQLQCIAAAVRRGVPRGALVDVGKGTTQLSQMVADAATLWAVPTADPARARWHLTLVPGTGCDGLRLDVVGR